jgi:hypothetical protein
MISPRGPMATRRMTAHWVVLAAAALTTLVAAAVAAMLAVFTGQALPLAVQHDLVTAPDTTLSITALVSGPSQAAQGSATLRSQIAAAMPGIPFSLREAFWSNPLGLVPGALPATPAIAGKSNTALLQAASMNGIASHAVLVAGRWPTTSGDTRSGAIPAALPASAAALLHVSAGDVLRLRDRSTNALVSFDITGVFTRRQGAANSYWHLSYIPASGISTGGGSTTYGPLIVSQAAFGTALTMGSGSWVGQPDMTAFSDSDLNPIAANVTSLSKSLPTASFLNGAQLTTSLPSVLSGAGSDLVVARSVLVISALQLLVLASAALLAVARLLAAQREGETALLVARGATRSQLTRLTAVEVVPLSALVTFAGAIAGIWLASALASAGPLGTAGIRLAGRPGSWPDAIGAALVVWVIAVAALLAPGTTHSPTAARVRRGRQAMVAGVARAGLDIALVVLAVLSGWQLRQYSAASNGGTAGIDPVLALAPALALAAGSVATLRLLPLAARTTDRLAARGKGLVTSLAGWQFSRMPIRQGSAALLLIMAVAAGTLALAQHESWTRSASDQATFATGGDVQVNLPAQLEPGVVGAVSGARGVAHSLAVATDIQASPGEVIAVDSAQAPQVSRLRGDESRLSSASLFRAITPSGGMPGAVLQAPQPGARAGTIRLTAALGLHAPTSPSPDANRALAAQLGPVTVTLTILDATGSAYQVAAGTLVADALPHLLVASLGGSRARYPLRVAAITATYLMPPSAAPSLALTVSGLPLAGWTGDASSPALDDFEASEGYPPAPGAPPGPVSAHITSRAATFTFSSGYGLQTTGGAAAPPATAIPAQLVLVPTAARVAAIPAIATGAFMDTNSTVIGSVVPASIQGEQVPLRIVAEVTSFPTVTAQGGALITDLGSVQEYLARHSAPPLPVTQWWLATANGSVPPALTASVPAGTDITSAAGLAAAVTSDPLSAAPQLALLAMAAAAALLALTGFWVSIAADVRQRRAETALLAALGVTRRGAALQLCLEKLLLSLPSATLGVLLGLLVARLIVPAVTLTPTAQQPTPPAVTLYDLPQAIALALAVAVLPAVFAVLAATRRPDPAAELRAAESA